MERGAKRSKGATSELMRSRLKASKAKAVYEAQSGKALALRRPRDT